MNDCTWCAHLRSWPGGYSECSRYGCQLLCRQPCEQCLREDGYEEARI